MTCKHHVILKVIHNPSLNRILLNACVYKVCQYHSVTEYFIFWLISSFVIQSCIVEDFFAICNRIGLTWTVEAYVEACTINVIPDCVVKKYFWINKLAWECFISQCWLIPDVSSLSDMLPPRSKFFFAIHFNSGFMCSSYQLNFIAIGIYF